MGSLLRKQHGKGTECEVIVRDLAEEDPRTSSQCISAVESPELKSPAGIWKANN